MFPFCVYRCVDTIFGVPYFDTKVRNIKMYHQQHLPPAASVPKPWTGASSAKRQWAPIRAPTPKVPSINNVVDFFSTF